MVLNFEKGILKIIENFGEDKLDGLLEDSEEVFQLIYGIGGDDVIDVYLPYNDVELKEAENLLDEYLESKLNFKEDFEEKHFVDICRRLSKTYEGNELLELKLFFKILGKVSNIDLREIFNLSF